MGARGPKPGFKQARAAAAAAVQAPAPQEPVPVEARAADGVVTDPAEAARLPAQHREHPRFLGGEALKQLAHRRGLARSECDRLDDERLRVQLNYLISRQYRDRAEA